MTEKEYYEKFIEALKYHGLDPDKYLKVNDMYKAFNHRPNYKCIKCGSNNIYKLNMYYFECIECNQTHEFTDFNHVIKKYPPITFLTQEQEDERIKRD